MSYIGNREFKLSEKEKEMVRYDFKNKVVVKDNEIFFKGATGNVKIGNITENNVKKDIGNKIRNYLDKSDLAKEIWNLNPYFYDKSKIWWLWNLNETKWFQCDDKDILNMVSDLSTANTVNAKDKSEILESMQQYGRRKIPKKIKSTWIQFKDKIIDFNNGNEFKATPEYFITNPIPWELSEDKFENTPTIDRIFEEWVGKDLV